MDRIIKHVIFSLFPPHISVNAIHIRCVKHIRKVFFFLITNLAIQFQLSTKLFLICQYPRDAEKDKHHDTGQPLEFCVITCTFGIIAKKEENLTPLL